MPARPGTRYIRTDEVLIDTVARCQVVGKGPRNIVLGVTGLAIWNRDGLLVVTPDMVEVTGSESRASATRRIAASAKTIFLLVSDPARHVEIDGTEMLQASANVRPLTEVGQTFDMNMDRRPLGDIPDLAEYQVRCTVTQLVPNRLVEWTVQAVGKPPAGHVWGWQIEEMTDDECFVTNYCDWSNINDDLRAKFQWPVVPVDRFRRSLDNLEQMAIGIG